MRTFFHRRVVHPLLDLLRMGATPEALAWSLAIGVVVGVNPLLGSTTLLALALAGIFRLNLVASQIGNHIMYPVQLALFPVWVRLGTLLFHTPGLPMGKRALIEAVTHHPWDTTRILWTWEWHALVVWGVASVVAAPALKLLLTPLMRKLARHLHHPAVASGTAD
ncbi:DUF2062 domain-containing protein [Bryocella elongata]|nr:DUF2062 domain-containing protein [Bryocella elongata]